MKSILFGNEKRAAEVSHRELDGKVLITGINAIPED